mmetsp:Transcript_46009/g.75054  ORF Transcript_46009/g.75054 Transcript_46009/m.75054 type:complete len:1069 (-) Transcript_46009:310-3516(-)|eukprot:CAMPEP_0184659804 /NCGR_PEP_ID=MMETSP0308-20130426/31121_1 /TAXON_ID=38269 /ORGANISM="Gloeochaete witrockiana, Strain SAG 46.84" /LENGTH=1068 /DNA_ID=CAMNT_0027099893 /DNA_START=233 /DNA_END=3439 /DNA_ORIENTATION=+
MSALRVVTAQEYNITAQDLATLVEDKNGTSLAEKGGVEGMARLLHVELQTGIDSEDAADISRRQDVFGVNRIPEPAQVSIFVLMWDALHDFTLIILLIAAAISLVLGLVFEDRETGWIEGVAIIVAVLVVVLVSSVNDYQKEKQFRALSAVRNNKPVKVLRAETVREISIYDLVVGDVIELSTGDAIPGDALLVHGNDIKVDESAMTGESDAVSKRPSVDPFLLSGTTVVEGDGTALVVAVGVHSRAGQITALLTSGERETTPLQKKLEKIAHDIGKLGLLFAVLTLVALFVRFGIEFAVQHKTWKQSMLNEMLGFFIIAVVVLVVAVPEGLPLAVTIALAYSVKKMLADQNLVRHLDACETMGGATTICSDKTGTLTTNRMSVIKCLIGGTTTSCVMVGSPRLGSLNSRISDLINLNIALNTTASVERSKGGVPEYIGNKTECALLQFLMDCGADYKELRKYVPIAKRFPFSSSSKRMSTIVQAPTRGNLLLCPCASNTLLVKGASEIVLGLCTRVLESSGKVEALTDFRRSEVLEIIERFANDSLRTLCLAYRDFNEAVPSYDEEGTAIHRDLVLLGVFGIKDPVRKEVPEAVAQCANAGIVVRMVTGDNIATAKAVAKECGILDDTPGSNHIAMEGPQFRSIVGGTVLGADGQYRVAKLNEFRSLCFKLRVLARSSPDDKHTLVCGLKELGEVVAVTGDGTNDAPALKRADVGFSMGITGTEVAKQASDIIILDDNFSSIVKAVMWGRNVYDAIRKFLQFQLTINLVAISITFIGACTGKGSPLGAVQMLWVNLIMDTFASLALATEPPTRDLLNRKPYSRDEYLVNRLMWRAILGHFAWQCLIMFSLLYAGPSLLGVEEGSTTKPSVHYTMIFNTFVMLQVFNQINCRKLYGEINVFEGIFKNPIFVGILLVIIVGQILIVTLGGHAFKVVPLPINLWLISVAIGFSSLVVGFLLRFIPVNLFGQWGNKEISLSEQLLTPTLLRRPSDYRIPTRLSKQSSNRDVFEGISLLERADLAGGASSSSSSTSTAIQRSTSPKATLPFVRKSSYAKVPLSPISPSSEDD